MYTDDEMVSADVIETWGPNVPSIVTFQKLAHCLNSRQWSGAVSNGRLLINYLFNGGPEPPH